MSDSYVTSAAMRREARQGLAWRREHNRGGTAIGVARARTIAAGQRIPLDTVRRMHSFFSRHRVDLDAPANSNPKHPEYPGAGLIAWKLWGGSSAASWAKSIVERADAKSVTASAEPDDTPDDDNLLDESGVHHTSCGRWPHHDDEFYAPTQPRAKDGKWTAYGSGSVSPSALAVAGRERYMRGTPRVDAVDYSTVRVPTALRARAASLYEKMPMNDPAAHKAWQSLRSEVKAQYDFITKTLGIKVQVVHRDPYANVKELVDDIEKNKTLKVMATSTTGGHPLFTNEENDMFRAVHDFFGHAATGRDFGRHGERATYLAHAATMRNKDSVRALFTETEMQNAYLIKHKEFGPQKIGLAPDSLVFNGVHTNAQELGIDRNLGELHSVTMDRPTTPSTPKYTVAARARAAKAGTAMKSGKFPIRNRAELEAAIRRRHQSTEPDAAVNAHIRKRAKKLGVKLNVKLSNGSVMDTSSGVMEFAVGKRDESLKWPWLYDVLRSKGYDKSKAAAIANSRLKFRKKGRLNVLGPKQAENMKRVRAEVKKAGY